MKCIIGLGKLHSFYIYILGSIFFKIISYLSLHFSFLLKDCVLVKNIYEYLGFFIFGFLFLFIEKRNSKSSTEKNYINTPKITYKDVLIFFLICFIFVIYYDCLKIIKALGFQDLEFWTFHIIIYA